MKAKAAKTVRAVKAAVALGPRLYLRPVTLADAGEKYLRWMNDPEVNQYLESRFARATLAGLKDFIRSMRKDPAHVFLAIVLRDDDRHIGNIKLGPINRTHGFGEIGIMLGEKDCWGRGYATEAIETLCRHAFGTLGLHKLTAGAYASNKGSIKAFLRAGFSREGVRRSQYRRGDAWEDLVVMGRVDPARDRAACRTPKRDPKNGKGK